MRACDCVSEFGRDKSSVGKVIKLDPFILYIEVKNKVPRSFLIENELLHKYKEISSTNDGKY